MKFHFALLGVLCVHALARDENNKWLKATAKSTGATRNERLKALMTKRDFLVSPNPTFRNFQDTSAVVVRTTPPSQSNGASIMSSCSAGTIDKITVGVQGIQARNGVEYVYIPMDPNYQLLCFDYYSNTVLVASDLTSCCDAAAERKFNSFRFEGGVCTGFTEWLSPIHTECIAESGVSTGVFVAKKKLSNFARPVPTFKTTFRLTVARISVKLSDIVAGCKYGKTLKVIIYSKTVTEKLDIADGSFSTESYFPELCDDNASADKRTVTVSIHDWDGSVLASVTEVLTSQMTGRYLLSNGVCVLYKDATQKKLDDATSYCADSDSYLPFADGFLPLADLLQGVVGLQVNVGNYWTDAYKNIDGNWLWFESGLPIDTNLFNSESLTTGAGVGMLNVTDGLLYAVDAESQYSNVCIDAPWI